VNSLKTLCMAIVLSAVAYGVYATLTGKPDVAPPPEAGSGWDQSPAVQLPEGPAPVPTVILAEEGPGATPTSPPAGAEALAGMQLPTDAPPFGPADAGPSVPPAGDAAIPSGLDGGSGSTVPPQEGQPTSFNAEPQSPPVRSDFAEAMDQTQALLDEGRMADALLNLSGWYDDPRLTPEQQTWLNDLLDQLAGTVIYSRQHLLEPAYEVQPGDTLQRVAELYNVPWELLAKINGVQDPQRLATGARLKVLRGPFHARVDLAAHRLTLFLEDRYAGRFTVGIGRDGSTPEGEIDVRDKIPNPTYYGPDRTIDSDDPANPLGEFWIGLGSQLGIHGTNDPASIGGDESRGCIRLSPRDAQDVYDILSIGSRVTIRR